MMKTNRKWTVTAAALLLMAGGAGAAAAQQGGAPSGGMDHGQHHGGMSADTPSKGSEHGGAGHEGMGKGGCMMMGSGSGGMDHGAKGESGGMMMRHVCRTGEHVEGRLAYLKAELKLTDAQTPQWNAFADAFRASGQKVAQYCASLKEQSDKGKPSGILQQFGLMERNMTAHLEFVRAIKAAAEPLFGVLTEEQKKTADETMTGLMGLGMGMGKH